MQVFPDFFSFFIIDSSFVYTPLVELKGVIRSGVKRSYKKLSLPVVAQEDKGQ